MGPNVRSAVIAGVAAFVLYVLISLLTGGDFAASVGVGLIFLLGTAAITFAVATLISRSKAH